LRSALTAFLVVHVRVELPPDAIEVGFAAMPAAGVCAETGTQNIPVPIQMNQQPISSIRTCWFSREQKLRISETIEFNLREQY
jgi:hypothetical protein